MCAQNKYMELLDLLPILLAMVIPIVVMIMISNGIEYDLFNTTHVMPYTELFPAWTLIFYFGGWYITIIIISWMILEYKAKEKSFPGKFPQGKLSRGKIYK